ncbi:hypothetical protein L228DRAFT_269336 [Xylona heveae TC161]|uniref:Cora-domain-containing protein n=1 Tax=Xylona heveae (strain CBS 132557 / TC161) TaxID=1328760 RepID=A0A165G8Y0_XYLHT|nr:hypothetical protein L228DRAFT_269336 [Xylona heveae TC161]KZF21887.1 hypothetical protein L228DRAFT_269336 [Xylona heveae TC161]
MVMQDVRANLEKPYNRAKYLWSTSKQYNSRSAHEPRAAHSGHMRGPSGKSFQESRPLAIFVSLPYIELYAMAKRQAVPDHIWQNSHPTRTLLQFFHHYESTTLRDLKQAVLQMKDTPKDHIYHVPQLWCLLIGHELIITCCKSSASDLQGKGFKFAPPTATDSPCAINLRDDHQRDFLFPTQKCASWSNFIEQVRSSCPDYSNYDPDIYYFTTNKGHTVTPETWSGVLSEETADILVLYIKVKSYQKLLDSIANHHQRHSRHRPYRSDKESNTPFSRESRTSVHANRPVANEAAAHNLSAVDAQAKNHGTGGSKERGPDDPKSMQQKASDKTESTQTQNRKRVNPVLLWSRKTPWWEDDFGDVKLSETSIDVMEEAMLDDIHAHLSDSTVGTGTGPSDSELFRCTREHTFEEFLAHLQKLKSACGEQHTPRYPNGLQTQSRVAETFQRLLQFFLPCNVDLPEVKKCLGSMIKATESSLNSSIRQLLADLEIATATIQDDILRSDSPPCSAAPMYFHEAFEHLVMFFVLAGESIQTPELTERVLKAGYQCKERLLRGEFSILEMLSTGVEDDAIRIVKNDVDNRGMLSMIMDTLIFNFTHGKSSSVINARNLYKDYLDQLEEKVLHHPNNRVMQQINYLIDELSMIARLLKIQREVAHTFNRIVKENSKRQPESSTTDFVLSAGEKRDDKLYRRIVAFSFLINRAERLWGQGIQQMKIREDDSSKAIMVFTVITTVFLPLTFVTGYLGMNTSDIRDMNRQQGLFWEIALPLTFVTLVLSLVLAFFGDNVRQRYYEWKQLRKYGR